MTDTQKTEEIIGLTGGLSLAERDDGNPAQKINENGKKIRNIILIGRTGNGKSTLANVISDAGDAKKFKESEFGVSETRDIQAEMVEADGINYQIIDTIGIGDTSLNPRDVLFRIAKAAHMVEKDGVHQILFVSKGRFTKEEIDAYNLLRTVIFDHNVVKYTTIVRSGFSSFRKPDKCAEDERKLLSENEEMADVISSCKKVLYVNNPSIDTGDEEEEAVNKGIRAHSRNIILLHLGLCEEFYKPKNLDKLNERIGGVITAEERQIKLIADFDKRLKEEKDLSDQERKKLMEDMEKAIKEKEALREEAKDQMIEFMKERTERLEARVEELEKPSCIIS